jgi:hypothetical protein
LDMRPAQGPPGGGVVVATRVDNSDFLRITRDLRRVHSHIAALAYPVLERAVESEGRDAGAAPAPATRALSE